MPDIKDLKIHSFSSEDSVSDIDILISLVLLLFIEF